MTKYFIFRKMCCILAIFRQKRKKKKKEKKTAVQEWKLENANNEASGGRRQKHWEEEKDLRKKEGSYLWSLFFLHPRNCWGICWTLMIFCGFRRRLTRPRSARPPPPIVCIIHRSPCGVWPGMVSSAAELFVCRYYLRLLRLRHHYKYRVVAGTLIVCWVMHAWMAFPASLSLSLSRIVSPPQLLRSLLTTWLAGPQQPANSRRDSPLKSRHHPRLRRLPLSRNPKTFHPNLSLSFFVSVKTSVVTVLGGSGSCDLLSCLPPFWMQLS